MASMPQSWFGGAFEYYERYRICFRTMKGGKIVNKELSCLKRSFALHAWRSVMVMDVDCWQFGRLHSSSLDMPSAKSMTFLIGIVLDDTP